MRSHYRDMFYEMTNHKKNNAKEAPSNGIISLFAGAGGMDLGFERAGFKTIWANEYDKSIAPSYQGYFKDTAFDGRSITQIEDSDIPMGIGVIGGPPCQSWSEAGARRGIDDPRGQLFHEYIRVIQHVQPLFFVAENVHGLIHSRNKESFENILKMLEQCGYRVSWKLVTASDYGVPQDRQRVFIVGYHNKLGKQFTFPKPLTEKPTLRQAIGDMARLKIGSKKFPNHEISTTGYSPMFMSRNRVRDWDEQSFTILACDRHTPLHPQAPKMIHAGDGLLRKFADGHEDKYRRFTVRECARIQTFPDDYIFKYNHVRDGYKMIGNAVPVELAKHIAAAIKQDIDLYHGNTN
jgi:DNA (cytosine-5)-methyltransferase 1